MFIGSRALTFATGEWRGAEIATASDRQKARREIRAALNLVIEGLRGLATVEAWQPALTAVACFSAVAIPSINIFFV